MAGSDIKTRAIILRQTNYGEADRILNVLTPEGKMAVIAKGVRKEKSKLAGGTQTFSLSEINVHKGRSEFLILTGAKTIEFYQGLVADLDRLEAAAVVLKKISGAAEIVDNPDFFKITVQALRALNKGGNISLILAWFQFNLVALMGEQVNLYKDTNGRDLVAGEKYTWDAMEKALSLNTAGKISTDEIKMMRLFLNADIGLVLKVKGASALADELLYIAKTLSQQ